MNIINQVMTRNVPNKGYKRKTKNEKLQGNQVMITHKIKLPDSRFYFA